VHLNSVQLFVEKPLIIKRRKKK